MAEGGLLVFVRFWPQCANVFHIHDERILGCSKQTFAMVGELCDFSRVSLATHQIYERLFCCVFMQSLNASGSKGRPMIISD